MAIKQSVSSVLRGATHCVLGAECEVGGCWRTGGCQEGNFGHCAGTKTSPPASSLSKNFHTFFFVWVLRSKQVFQVVFLLSHFMGVHASQVF